MNITVSKTTLSDILIIEPKIHFDNRGFFFESFNAKSFINSIGASYDFVQDNHSKSSKGVLRGLHYQSKRPQGKLVRVIYGSIYDVAVDIREGSHNFGKWFGLELSADNKKQLWIPPGFAHGFLVLSESAEVLYKTTDYYMPEYERTIIWNDKDIGINWPKTGINPIISDKDKNGFLLKSAELPEFKK